MTAALFLVRQVFDLQDWGKLAVTGHVERGVIKPGDVLTLRRSGSSVRVEGLNFPGQKALDKDQVALLIPRDTEPIPRNGGYLEGDDR